MEDIQMNKRVSKGAIIKVIGVGGGGNNAVNRMVDDGLQGVDFYVANTDLQSLEMSNVKNKIELGPNVTGGLGAGAVPEMGKKSALESEDEIREHLKGADMIFITAGMGGGTGTGAAPIIARIAQEEGALTVGVVTKPFSFEGPSRMRNALNGIEEMREYVDSLIIVSNNKVLEIIGNISFNEAFLEADNVLRQAVQTITDLIAVPSLINLDFADISTIMAKQGNALIGIGMASGENKARQAAQQAITSPLLEAQINGARKAIINITGGPNVAVQDGNEAVEFIRDAAGTELEIIFGIALNDSLGDSVIVTVIATGFEDTDKKPHSFRSEVAKERKVEIVEDIDSDIPDFFRR
jgi:cell division protein FtsZ